MGAYRKLFVLLVMVGGLIGCSGPKVTFREAAVLPGDQKEAPYPPQPKDLLSVQPFVVFGSVQMDTALSASHKDLSMSFLRSMLQEEGSLQFIQERRIQTALQRPEFQNYSGTSPKDVVALATHLRAKYAAVVQIIPSREKVEDGEWATYMTLEIYQSPSGNKIFNQSFDFVSSKTKELWEKLKPEMQDAFPLRGFISETRNNRTFARISLGKADGVKPKRLFGIFRRDIQAVTKEDGSTVRRTIYSSVGQLEITDVMERESWGTIRERDRGKVLKGDAVFSKAEQR